MRIGNTAYLELLFYAMNVRVRFLSVEPLLEDLGIVDLAGIIG